MDLKENRKLNMVVNPKMHYALFLALVISLITTFLLGLLLTETLWGTGLTYFDQLSREGRVQPAAAQRPVREEKVKASLEFSNVLNRTWTSDGQTYYEFTVTAKNIGKKDIKELEFLYNYDLAYFRYIPGGSGSLSKAPREKRSVLTSIFKPKPAHAQVSIDFPIPTTPGQCTLRGVPSNCDMSESGGILSRGSTWKSNLTFQLVGGSIAEKPSVMKKIFSWLFGTKTQAQVSIDFPTFPVTTETTATVVKILTVQNKLLNEHYSSTASVTLY